MSYLARISSSPLSQFFPLSILSIAFTLLAGTVTAHGQQTTTATAKRTSEISAFALYSRVHPDYGPSDNNGFTVGANYTLLNRWWINPSIEFRAKVANGSTADEKTFGGGIRGVKKIGRFSPYGDFLISYGSINLHLQNPPVLPDGSPYKSDTSIVYSYGGGLDYRAFGPFSVRGDFQYEKWYMDKLTNPYKPLHLSPYNWSMGVVYTIPFRRGR